MEIGILGLTSSGKTTLFALLTGQDASSVAVARGATSGIAKVPDARLDALSAMFQPKKHTPATIQYVDVPGIPAEHGRDGSLNIPELRTMDVLMVVLRAFDSEIVPHPLTTVDPVRDLEHIEQEFLLQDLMVVEKRLERLAKDLAKRKVPELEAERDVLLRCQELLEESRPLRSGDFSDVELKRLRGFTFLSLKPLLVILNLDENEVGSDPLTGSDWSEIMARPKVAGTSVCATLESEIEQLEGDDATAFMEDLGLTDRALDRVIQESYRLLGLISFFTVGEDECRAWSVGQGTPAVEAAGSIHSDIQRGFIRAEVVAHDELLSQGSLANCRQAGSLRLEGKSYTVTDGDVIHFRFNV